MKKPLMLMILDGYGINDNNYGNAIKAARTPKLDALMARWPVTQLMASGLEVGLPEGQMGNSEVGHTNIGAGRVVYQELTAISKSISDGDFFKNDALLAAVNNCKKQKSALHLMGLLSDGGVHSHNTHLYALLRLASLQGLSRVYIHCFMDGRDVPPKTGAAFIEELSEKIREIGVGSIATISGRYYAMDRDNRWERVNAAYDAIRLGEGGQSGNALDVLPESYAGGVTDEFVVPTICDRNGRINENDSVIFFNFRPDRARQITRALCDPGFDAFPRKNGFANVHFVCMTQYDALMPNVEVAFQPRILRNTLGEYISSFGLTQLRIAETEKYAHVTFFFNGGIETVYPGEDRVLIASPKVATYDLAPQMSAFQVADEAVGRIRSGIYDVIIINFANCDMVGHTGVFDAAVKAVEAVDACAGKCVDAVLDTGGMALVTSDHGNAEKMYESDRSPFTAHTTNKVPLIGAGLDRELLSGGILADLAPTMLDILGLARPPEMLGKSLIAK